MKRFRSVMEDVSSQGIGSPPVRRRPYRLLPILPVCFVTDQPGLYHELDDLVQQAELELGRPGTWGTTFTLIQAYASLSAWRPTPALERTAGSHSLAAAAHRNVRRRHASDDSWCGGALACWVHFTRDDSRTAAGDARSNHRNDRRHGSRGGHKPHDAAPVTIYLTMASRSASLSFI